MSKKNKHIRVGIYLCDCDGRISEKVDLNKVKTVIQSEADFEYIRVANVLCGKVEQERLAKEIDKYSLNRLLIAGCTDPFIMRQFLQVAEENGLLRYYVDFVDLAAVGEGKGEATEAAILAVNNVLANMQLRGEVGLEELEVVPDVLVVGCGKEGAVAALTIAQSQPVVMIDGGGGASGAALASGNPRITVKTGARLVGLEGFPGNFTARISENGKVVKQNFGAVVLALEAQPVFDKGKYGGVEPGERILLLSQFVDAKKEFAGQRISFVLGKADPDSLLSYAAVLKEAISLKEKGAVDVNIFYEDMKVSADNLEQYYEKARALGVNFLKYAGDLEIYPTVVAATVQYREPFLPQAPVVRVTSDYLVLAEDYVPAPVTRELAETLDLRLGPGGFFQEDNVHFLPIKSNREGIYFVGSCHGPIHGVDLAREAEAVAAEVSRFAKGKLKVPALQPRVEAEKCAVCLTCYRTCPHKAIEIVHDESLNNMYHSAARMHPLACRRCGTCAAECPGKAIQLPFYSDQEILFKVTKPPRLVAYACENSGALAAEFAQQLEPEVQKDLQIIRVPCSGKIDVIYLLKALERGADGVMLFVCHRDNCKYVWGNERAEKRKEQVRKLLNDIGIEGERVEFVHVAANQGNQFNSAVRAMAEKIRQLGTNPGKVVK
ncbi:MAG: hydrogenase iron-sulfur subunit [Firmicutes bacterium]|nr:hydrogenase iron-sulfur subunit [Bacillota bacterium]